MSLFEKKRDARGGQDFERLEKEVKRLGARVVRVQEALGRIEARQCAPAPNFAASEFRAFSQWGEDGLIQFLIRQVEIQNQIFVEFGVESYVEANTRFLLTNNNWSGLVIDGSADNVRRIKKSAIYWQHNLKAVEAFVTRENINALLVENGLSGAIGLLSIDVDGNDYWIWQAIDAVTPAILVLEYNARFGAEEAVTVPYDSQFTRARAHHSLVYYGASLRALTQLSKEKGYALVGCNTAGNNAFFVREDLRPAALPARSVAEAFVPCQFREARGVDGSLAHLTFEQEQKLVFSLPLERL